MSNQIADGNSNYVLYWLNQALAAGGSEGSITIGNTTYYNFGLLMAPASSNTVLSIPISENSSYLLYIQGAAVTPTTRLGLSYYTSIFRYTGAPTVNNLNVLYSPNPLVGGMNFNYNIVGDTYSFIVYGDTTQSSQLQLSATLLVSTL